MLYSFLIVSTFYILALSQIFFRYKHFYIQMLEEKTEEIVDGNWGEWSQWTPCSQKCNGGMRTRERLCNNPEPSEFGKSCEGEGEDSQACNEEEGEAGWCKVDKI